MPERIRTNFERTEKKENIIPEPLVMPDGMFQCPVCNQTFLERDIYEDHYADAHADNEPI